MQLTLCDLSGHSESFDISEDSTVNRVCDHLSDQLQIPSFRLRLIGGGRFLPGSLQISALPSADCIFYQVVLPDSESSLQSPAPHFQACMEFLRRRHCPFTVRRQYQKYAQKAAQIPKDFERLILILCEMGFPRDEAKEALQISNFIVEQSIQYLTDRRGQGRALAQFLHSTVGLYREPLFPRRPYRDLARVPPSPEARIAWFLNEPRPRRFALEHEGAPGRPS
jgi:hypothetical protein